MNATATLTKREIEIAELIAWGATKKDVANSLNISERTAENHARNIYEKTGVTKVNELSAWWFCTRFNISFDMSPLRRSIIAMIFLLLVIPRELTGLGDSFRVTRVRRTECRKSSKSNKSEYEFDF